MRGGKARENEREKKKYLKWVENEGFPISGRQPKKVLTRVGIHIISLCWREEGKKKEKR